MKFYYVLYVIFIFLGGTISISGISLRIILTLILFIICAYKKSIKTDKILRLFPLYLFFFIISGLITDTISETLKFCVSWYFCAYTLYMATKYLVGQQNGTKIVVYTLLAIGIIDAIVTIGQAMGNTFAYELGLFADDEYMDELAGKMDRRGGVAGVIIPGLIGASNNGTFLPVICVLSFFSVNNKQKLFNLPILSISLVASILVQERTGTFIAVVFSAYLIWKNYIQSGSFIYRIIAVLSIIVAVSYFASLLGVVFTGEHSRYGSVNEGYSLRQSYFSNTLEYLRSNPFGGYFDYIKQYKLPPHNLFLNAFVYGGLFGGLIGVVMYIMQFVKCWYGAVKVKKSGNRQLIIFSLAYLATVANSLTHNCSFIRGDAMCWLLLALLVSNIEIYKSNQYNNNAIVS